MRRDDLLGAILFDLATRAILIGAIVLIAWLAS